MHRLLPSAVARHPRPASRVHPLSLPLTAAALWLAAAVTLPAQDTLRWNSTGSGEWTDAVWYDTTASVQSVGNAGTDNFTFLGNAAHGTVAPAAMTIDNSVSASSITFADGFNAANTTTVASGRTDGLATEAYLTGTTWAINDQASSGTVTFNTSATGTYGLYLGLNNTGTITVASANASLVLNTALTNYGTAGGITKAGAGSLTLSNSNGYTGGTTVNAGTLIVAGTTSSGLGLGYGGTGSGTVTVNSGGTLAGTGTVYGATTVNGGGTLAPGTSSSPTGILAVGNSAVTSGLTLNGTLRINLLGGGTTAGVNNSELQVAGTVQLGVTSSQLAVNTLNAAGLARGQKFFLVLNDGVDPVVGTFQNLAQGATVRDNLGDSFTISYLDNGDGGTLGNDVSLTVTGVVPEPSTWALLGLGAAATGVAVQRRRRRV